MSFLASDCSCNGGYIPTVVPCTTCGTDGPLMTPNWIEATQRVIQNQVRVPASQYLGSLAAMNVIGPITGTNSNLPKAQYAFVNWNQSSDRAVPSVTNRNVPSHGNSTRTSLTRARPGSQSAGGTSAGGTDRKHDSYQRYLLRKKGATIRPRAKAVTTTAYDAAYYKKYSLVQDATCDC